MVKTKTGIVRTRTSGYDSISCPL